MSDCTSEYLRGVKPLPDGMLRMMEWEEERALPIGLRLSKRARLKIAQAIYRRQLEIRRRQAAFEIEELLAMLEP